MFCLLWKKMHKKQVTHSASEKVSFTAMLSVENAIKATLNKESVMESESGKPENNIIIHGTLQENEL